METIIPGHFTGERSPDKGSIEFRCDPRINDHSIYGTTNQEVIRVLLARMRFLENQKPHPLNTDIIRHMECALALHETRAQMRKAEKQEINAEDIPTQSNGHW